MTMTSETPMERRLDVRLQTALLKLLKVAHPASEEALWAAMMLEEHGYDKCLEPRPNASCPVCGDPFVRHGRNVCFEPGCACSGRQSFRVVPCKPCQVGSGVVD